MGIYWLYRRYSKQKWKNNTSIKIHEKLTIILKELHGDRVAGVFSKVWIYVFFTKNPLAMSLYVVLSIVGYIFGFCFGIGTFIPGPYLGNYHKFVSAIIMSIGWILFIIACLKPSGKVTKEERDQSSPEEAFDNVLYCPDITCETCKI